MPEANIVGRALVEVVPVFLDSQRTIARNIGPAAQRAGRDAGRGLGRAMADGVSDETKALEAEAAKTGRVMSEAQEKVQAAADRTAAALRKEAKAQEDVRIAAAKLNEARERGSATSSRVLQAEQRVTQAFQRSQDAQQGVARAQREHTEATHQLGEAQGEAAQASQRLSIHMRGLADSSSNAERRGRALSGIFSRAFRGRPLGGIADNVDRDSRTITESLRKMSTDVSNSGTRGGRIFTRWFGIIGALLAVVPPLAGAAGAALVGASGAVLTLAGSIQKLAGVSALAPAGLIALAATGGVLKTAFSGMGEALKTATDRTTKTAGNAAASAIAMEDAAERIKLSEEQAARVSIQSARRIADAQEGLTEAREQAAQDQAAAVRKVADAERDVERANREVTRSQQALNDARKEATDRLKEMKDQLTDSALSEREAAIRLEEAKNDLREGQGKGLGSNSLAMRKLVLDVDQAAFALKEAKERSAELKEEQAQAAKEGVSGNKEVLRATEDLGDAQQGVKDAVEARKLAVADADRVAVEGARRIADAQDNIALAQEEAAEAQVDAARQVSDAYRDMAREQAKQADLVKDAGQKAADAMANLSPNAQRATRALLGVYERLRGIRTIIQDNFFAGFTGPLEVLANALLPQVERGAGRIATVLGAGLQQLMTSLTTGLDDGVLERLLGGVADSLEILNGAIDPIVQAFITLGVVGMDYMPGLATYIKDIADRFNTFIQGAAADGSLKQWIDDGIAGFGSLLSILQSTQGIFSALETAARAGGFNVTLEGIATGMERIRASMEGETFQKTMSTIFEGGRKGAEGLLGALGPIGDAFERGAPALAEFLRLGGEIAGLFIGNVFTAFSSPGFGQGLVDFMEGIRGGVETMGPKLPDLFDAIGRFLTDVAPVFEALGPTLIVVLTDLFDGLEKVMNVLSPFLTKMAESPAAVGLLIAAVAGTAALSALLTFAANISAIVTAGGALTTFFTWIGTTAPWIATGFRVIWAAITGPVGLIIAAIALLTAGIIWFFTQTDAGRESIETFKKQIGEAQVKVDEFTRAVVDRFNEAQENVDKFTEGVKDNFEDFKKGMGDAQKKTDEFTENLTTEVKRSFGDFRDQMDRSQKKVDDFTGGLKGMFEDLGENIKRIWDEIPGFIEDAVEQFGRDFDKLREKARTPVKYVIEEVFQKGIIEPINNILPDSMQIPDMKVPEGWRKGGFTGRGQDHEIAGPVHRNEFVFDAAATAAAGPERLAAMMDGLKTHGLHGLAATVGQGNMGGFFEGNAAAIRRHGAYYLNVPQSMAPWNFQGAARMWDGAAGVKVKVGRGQHQGWAGPLERGGGILGYTSGTNIDMSPSWMNMLGAAARRTVAAHEMGHALGLPHNSLNSIMQPNLANMASGPTAIDIRNLQALYPGGSGKAGSGVPDNPLLGIIGGLISGFQKQFAGGGMMAAIAKGLAQAGFDKVFGMVESIKNGLKNLVGGVVNGIKDFFGVAEPALVRDTGGILPPGFSTLYNGTGQNEMISNPQQIRDIQALASSARSAVAVLSEEDRQLLREVAAFANRPAQFHLNGRQFLEATRPIRNT